MKKMTEAEELAKIEELKNKYPNVTFRVTEGDADLRPYRYWIAAYAFPNGMLGMPGGGGFCLQAGHVGWFEKIDLDAERKRYEDNGELAYYEKRLKDAGISQP